MGRRYGSEPPTRLYGHCAPGRLGSLAFDWDHGNREKCQKHAVTIERIEALFASRPTVLPDLKHSGAETRAVAFGRIEGRALFVGFTLRTRDGVVLIRPVTARYMHAKEARRHE